MEKHGLAGWTFGFDNAKRRAGLCNYTHKHISLSIHFVAHNSDEQVRDTILHEIAHALAGHEAGHGLVWMYAAARIGAEPKPCYDSATTVMPKGRWRALCPGCNKEFSRFRRPKRTRFCIDCGINRGTLTYHKVPR
jgi:predicted SprT family Zn-dependent metalloprotease